MSSTRRDFLRTIGAGAATIASSPLISACGVFKLPPASVDFEGPLVLGWDRVPITLARIRAPQFASREFDITRYGAVPDGRTDATDAIRRTIAACEIAGGGRVVVPAGRFLSGPLHLRSNVELHVSKGATIAFDTNVAITGEGTLDGQAGPTNWWTWKGSTEYGWKTGDPHQKAARDRLFALAESNTPVAGRVFTEGSYLRSSFVQPYECRDVLVEGVTIVNSPMWEIHPVLSRNVTVRNVKIITHGPNNDGCNPESCADVLIDNCDFDTGDDCIAIKSGRNADGRRLATPSQDIIVRNCRMKDGHGGVTIGSEISGGARHIYAHDCRMDSPNLDRALRFKNNAMRGGLIEHVYMRDVTVGHVADSVLSIDLHYEEGANGPFAPVIRDVELRRVTSRKSNYALYARTIPNSTIENIRVIDCAFDGVVKGSVTEGVRGLEYRNTTVNGAPVR
jgi:polygalacturonase